MITACAFMEKAGGVDKADHLTMNPLVQARFKEYAVTASRDTRPTKKAPPTTFVLIAAFELAILDECRPTFERMFCWHRCVRAWSAMRFDDHRGLLPSRMRMLPFGLRGSLVRTKTAGV